MYLLLKMVVFHCYVSLPEGKSMGNFADQMEKIHLPVSTERYWKLHKLLCIYLIWKLQHEANLHHPFGRSYFPSNTRERLIPEGITPPKKWNSNHHLPNHQAFIFFQFPLVTWWAPLVVINGVVRTPLRETITPVTYISKTIFFFGGGLP